MRNWTAVIALALLLAVMVIIWKDVFLNTVRFGFFLLAVGLTGVLVITVGALVIGWIWRRV
jgi:hypothetical protein